MMIALEARAGAEPPSVLAADQDLVGRWQVVVTFGRIGRHGHARRHAFEDEAGLSRFVRRALLRRRSATRRIGVSYEAVEASTFGSPSSHSARSRCPPAISAGAWEGGLRAGSRSIAGALDR
jgi:hypothetical protein